MNFFSSSYFQHLENYRDIQKSSVKRKSSLVCITPATCLSVVRQHVESAALPRLYIHADIANPIAEPDTALIRGIHTHTYTHTRPRLH